MTKTRVLVAVAVLVTVPFAGCIENMSDLKDRIQGTSEQVAAEEVDPLDTTNTTVNQTRVLKPPVARMSVFAANGALVYKSSFIAENMTSSPVIVEAGVLTFNAADSEVVQGGAELKTFAWTIDGKKSEGRKVEANVSEPGIHMVELKVTDSLGSTDSQMLHLGVPPTPFDQSTEFTGGPIADLESSGVLPIASGSHPFTVLAELDGKPLQVLGLTATVVAGAGMGCDNTLTLVDPEGAETTSDSNDATDCSETIALTTAAAGEWTAIAGMFAGAADSYTITITVTYVEVVEGLGEGHAGH